MSGKKKPYRHEQAMAQPNTVTVCLRMPEPLRDKLMEVQEQHMREHGEAISRNSIILNIVSRYLESGRGVQL